MVVVRFVGVSPLCLLFRFLNAWSLCILLKSFVEVVVCFGLLSCHTIKILLIILDEFLCKLSEYLETSSFILLLQS